MDKKINASPTKDFFIKMLTRDIDITSAIIELIDNSIDGARSIRPDDNFSGLKISITISKDEFTITDNCGGISLDTAINYAFRFGRPRTAPSSNAETTGIFGIGMKRALFKMGKNFSINSVSPNDSFQLDIDTEEWVKSSNDSDEPWEFSFTNLDNQKNALDLCGTSIKVTNLYPGIAVDFGSEEFLNKLKTTLKKRISFDLDKGITLEVNNTPLQPEYISIIESDTVKPLKKVLTFGDVSVTIIAGISNQIFKNGQYQFEPQLAGWYIYCNNRLIVSADKTALTTWNTAFHNEFASFRGLVYFNSKFPEYLPWNTAKTNIDPSSSIYLQTQLEMYTIFKAITSELRKLNALDDENHTNLLDTLNTMPTIPLNLHNIQHTIMANLSFKIINNVPSPSNPNPLVTISYKKPKSEVDELKNQLNVTSNKEVGERTFTYYKEMECD